MSCKVKICGITNVDDALMVEALGADYIGVLLDVEESPRSVSYKTLKEIIKATKIPIVVLLDKKEKDIEDIIKDLCPYAIQFLGDVTEENLLSLRSSVSCDLWLPLHLPPVDEDFSDFERLIKRLRIFSNAGIATVVIDTKLTLKGKEIRGGTGKISNWDIAKRLVEKTEIPIFLAGGLNPDNIRDAIKVVNPYGVDVSSGVESICRKKDKEKVERIIKIAKED